MKIWKEIEARERESSKRKPKKGTTSDGLCHPSTHSLAIVHASHFADPSLILIDPSLSSQPHTKPKERGRKLPKVKPVSTASQACAHLPPFANLPSLSSLRPTKAGLDTTCHWSRAFTQEPHPFFHPHSWHSQFESISPSFCNKPQAIPLPSCLLSLISLFLSNPNQTPYLFLRLIFVLFDLWFCCCYGGVGGGVLVGFVWVVVDIVWVVMGFVWMVDFLWWWWWWQWSSGGGFFPLPDLDFVWVVMGCACPWWRVASLGLNFLKIDFLHPRPNTRNNFLVSFPQHNQIVKNVFLYVKHFTLRKHFTYCQTQPKSLIVSS